MECFKDFCSENVSVKRQGVLSVTNFDRSGPNACMRACVLAFWRDNPLGTSK